jgi:PadR family transcriptional regulator PadR
MLTDQELYGLEIARRLTADGVLMSSEGTLYPLLARLRRAGLVDTTWQESVEGPPRRYYALTPGGRDALAAFTRTWTPFRDAVDAALTAGGDRS